MTSEELIKSYRWQFLRIASEAGKDTSDFARVGGLVFPDISDYAVDAVKELREKYEEALDEITRLERQERHDWRLGNGESRRDHVARAAPCCVSAEEHRARR